MFVGGTMFPHRRIYKGTWKSPENRNRSYTFLYTQDIVQSYRDPNVDNDHFHGMVEIRVRLSHQKKEKSVKQEKIDVEGLRNETVEREYWRQIEKAVESENLDDTENINGPWTRCKNINC